MSAAVIDLTSANEQVLALASYLSGAELLQRVQAENRGATDEEQENADAFSNQFKE